MQAKNFLALLSNWMLNGVAELIPPSPHAHTFKRKENTPSRMQKQRFKTGKILILSV